MRSGWSWWSRAPGQMVLRQVAQALIAKAQAGDVAAIREIADRLDGKVPQAIVGDDDEPPVRLQRIERVIVGPKKPEPADAPIVR